MKLRKITVMLLVLVLLWGCAPADVPTTAPTTLPTTSPTTQPTTENTPGTTTGSLTMPTTDPTSQPTTEPTTTPTEPDIFAEGYFDKIHVHPFSQADMNAALNALNTALASTANQEGVLSYQTNWVSFDPYYTALCVKAQMDQAPVEGWTTEDYYARKMLFVVNFTVDHDQSVSAATDYQNQLGVVALVRDTVDGAWTIDVDGCAPYIVCEPSNMILPPHVVDALGFTLDFTLAGYFDEEVGYYFLYVLDEDTNTIVCLDFEAGKID